MAPSRLYNPKQKKPELLPPRPASAGQCSLSFNLHPCATAAAPASRVRCCPPFGLHRHEKREGRTSGSAAPPAPWSAQSTTTAARELYVAGTPPHIDTAEFCFWRWVAIGLPFKGKACPFSAHPSFSNVPHYFTTSTLLHPPHLFRLCLSVTHLSLSLSLFNFHFPYSNYASSWKYCLPAVLSNYEIRFAVLSFDYDVCC